MRPALDSFAFKRAYVTRNVDLNQLYVESSIRPTEGDLVLTRVSALKRQTRLETPEGRRAFLFKDDLILGVVGKRYSTKHFAGFELPEQTAQLLTTSGIIGCANAKADNIKAASEVELLGVVVDKVGKPSNVKAHTRLPSKSPYIGPHPPVLLVVGSDMDSGKTTLASALIHGFTRLNLKTYAFKLTGSASGPDYWRMQDAGAQCTQDFLDGGFVSTTGVEIDPLLSLFENVLAHAQSLSSDLIVLEVADGLLQTETSALLESNRLQRSVSGVMLAAETALSGVYSTQRLEHLNYRLLGVGGVFTQYPLAIEEFSSQSAYPVFNLDLLEQVSGAQMISQALLGAPNRRAIRDGRFV